MPIKGFRDKKYKTFMSPVKREQQFSEPYEVEYHTGTYDRNNVPIFEGDTLRQITCTQTFIVEDLVDFLLMCGRYEEKHGAPIFDSLEVVTEERTVE